MTEEPKHFVLEVRFESSSREDAMLLAGEIVSANGDVRSVVVKESSSMLVYEQVGSVGRT